MRHCGIKKLDGMENKTRIQAVIFDMDGVISDTQSVCSQVESDLLKEHDVEIHPDEITRRYAGVRSNDMFADIFHGSSRTLSDIQKLSEERLKRVDAAINGNIRAIPGTLEFIARLKTKKMPMAIASASNLKFIELVLQELGIRSAFHSIASSREVRSGKPEPDVFLLAAKRLNVEPNYCLVIEDGVSGMVAARRAGMKCVGLVRHDKHDKSLYPADLLIGDLRELELENV